MGKVFKGVGVIVVLLLLVNAGVFDGQMCASGISCVKAHGTSITFFRPAP